MAWRWCGEGWRPSAAWRATSPSMRSPRLKEHLEALGEGRVPIVTREDLDALEKKGVSIYALDDPIVAAFTPEAP